MNESQSLLIACPKCQKPYRLKPDMAGKRVRCANPACGSVFEVPGPAKKMVPGTVAVSPVRAGREPPLDIAAQLLKLHQLRESGALSAEEFTQAKQAFLLRMVPTSPLTTPKEEFVTTEAVEEEIVQTQAVTHERKWQEKPRPMPPPLPNVPQAQVRAADSNDGENVVTPTKPQAGAAHAPTPPDLPYSPVAPKFAQLDAQEQHLYTFTLQPMFFRSFWTAFWSGGKPAGWQPDYARFVAHFTDKRILVESYDFSANEKLASKGFFALAKFAVGKLAALAPAGGVYNASMSEEGALMKDMLNKAPEWFAIDYTEIATVERQKLLFGRSLVKLSFRDPEREDLVFITCAAKAGAFSFKNCNKEFVAVVEPLLEEKARFQSQPSSKRSEKKEAAPKRPKAEEPDRNPGIKVLGGLGFLLGVVLMCAGAFSGKGVFFVLGMIVMLVAWFVWRPWGKDRKIASAWQGDKGTWKSRKPPRNRKEKPQQMPPPLPNAPQEEFVTSKAVEDEIVQTRAATREEIVQTEAVTREEIVQTEAVTQQTKTEEKPRQMPPPLPKGDGVKYGDVLKFLIVIGALVGAGAALAIFKKPLAGVLGGLGVAILTKLVVTIIVKFLD